MGEDEECKLIVVFDDVMVVILNLLYDDVLEGVDEVDNVFYCSYGEKFVFGFNELLKEYFEFGEVFGDMDFVIVVKLLGLWFVIFKG